MVLQVIQQISSTDKAVKVEFLHPRTLRHCFSWIPKGRITHLPFNQIQIPKWLWDKINKNL